MNELVLFYEQTHLTPYSPSVFFDSWSHWGELNPRPSPYQGDAIPLSHSGDGLVHRWTRFNRCDSGRVFINRLKLRMLLVGVPAEIA